MGYAKRKLVLFFTVQTLGVGAMIWLLRANRCGPLDDCSPPSPLPLILASALILAELSALAGILYREVPVWYALVGWGGASLMVAFFCGLAAFDEGAWRATAGLLAVWHVAIGLILFLVGAAAAVWDLVQRLGSRDDGVHSRDRQPTAMWPLD